MKTSIYSQHHDHTGWLSKLSFYNDEMRLMQKKLEEVNSKNTSADIRKQVEHFQNQLIIRENTSEDLRHHIKREEKDIVGMIRKNPVAADHRRTEDHRDERERVEAFERNFNQLRQEFNSFLAKTL